MVSNTSPVIIQGGMGVNVSSGGSPKFRRGQLGVVSGTALDAVLARGLQDGDHEGTCAGRSRTSPTPRWPRVLWTPTSGRAAVPPAPPTGPTRP